MLENTRHTGSQSEVEGGRRREVSRYTFPYYDLETAVKVATILYDQAGGKASLGQLAAYLGHKDEASGAFIAKVWGAKLFGLVRIEAQNVLVTPLGERLASLQPGLQRDRRLAEAFLKAPLFREVFKRYENSTLPSTREGLLNTLKNNFGVSSKRASAALKVLLASAEQAGFKRADPNRLIHPVPVGLMEKEVSLETGTAEGELAPIPSVQTSQTGITLSKVHPAISGFLQELPSEGKRWTENQRQRWLDAFSAIVKALYPAENE